MWGEMVIRISRHPAYYNQRFWGCSRYPECRGIINIREKYTVYVGSTVTVQFLPEGDEHTYTIFFLKREAVQMTGGLANTYQPIHQIVTNPGSPEEGWISDESPLGQALLDKKRGQTFTYTVDGKTFKGKILDVITKEV